MITMQTPRSIDKHKKDLQAKLKKAIERNQELKEINADLKEKNNRYLAIFGGKESETKRTGRLNIAGNRELHYKVLVFYKIKDNLNRLHGRESF